jgi:hypothetical protein
LLNIVIIYSVVVRANFDLCRSYVQISLLRVKFYDTLQGIKKSSIAVLMTGRKEEVETVIFLVIIIVCYCVVRRVDDFNRVIFLRLMAHVRVP